MSKNHPHVNSANDSIPDKDIKPPSIFGNFPLDEAVIDSDFTPYYLLVF